MKSYSKELESSLNALLEKNRDAEKGFKKAADHTEHVNLKNYFMSKSRQRRDYANQLKSEIATYGEKPDDSSSFTGAAHRAWMDVKALFSFDDEESMLEEAIRGEEAAVEEYDKIIYNKDLPQSTKSLLSKHVNEIRSGLAKIRSLEDLREMNY
tara:strand:+ start:3015 stop:3476 length:462 start_codon:yes stop_codon:yes gene_type:complete